MLKHDVMRRQAAKSELEQFSGECADESVDTNDAAAEVMNKH